VKRTTAGLLLATSVIAGSLAGAVLTALRSDGIAAGVTVASVDISGLSKAQAKERLSPVLKRLRTNPIVLRVEDREWRVRLRELGMSPDPDSTVAKAYDIGRHGNWVHQSIVRLFRGGTGKSLPVSIAFDLEKLDDALSDIARVAGRKHKDAKLRVVGGQFFIQPERSGIKVDVGRCAQDIAALSWHGKPVDLALVEDKPEVTGDDLRTIDGRLAGFTTRFPAFRLNRTHNIRLAVKMLDGALIKAGQAFSFNTVVGPRLKKLGYRDAPIFRNGELEPGTGGGVCQVSSTVYNAALYADLEILERSHHSGSVPYVPLGRDATVAYGLLDLRFRNNTPAPIYISAEIAGNRLTVGIYGSKSSLRDVAIQRTEPKRIPHRTITYTDASLPPGARVTKRPGHGGYSVSTYRVVKNNGVVIRRERISSDLYRPLHTKIALGPAVVSAQAQ
jgi:vancomycin resistance protein YoaR